MTAAAVSGLRRSDPRGPGITRVPGSAGFSYTDRAGSPVTDPAVLARIAALAIPPAWTGVWISADPSGHIQATGTDSRGRLQYRYHEQWREQRDAEKFEHMLRFAGSLPALRAAALRDLRRRGLSRDRVTASAVRLIDVGLFRIGGERYAELDHHYGVSTLLKQHVRVLRGGVAFDYVAKEGKRRAITVGDPERLRRPAARQPVRGGRGTAHGAGPAARIAGAGRRRAGRGGPARQRLSDGRGEVDCPTATRWPGASGHPAGPARSAESFRNSIPSPYHGRRRRPGPAAARRPT
jgi:hypothetical protein